MYNKYEFLQKLCNLILIDNNSFNCAQKDIFFLLHINVMRNIIY